MTRGAGRFSLLTRFGEAGGAEERFKEIQQAYDVLVTSEKKRIYKASSPTSPPTGTAGARTRLGERSGSSISPGELADLLAGLSELSQDPTSGHKEFVRELRSEDVARIAKLFGVDLTRIAKVLDEGVKMTADASFGAGDPATLPQEAWARGAGRRQGRGREAARAAQASDTTKTSQAAED